MRTLTRMVVLGWFFVSSLLMAQVKALEEGKTILGTGYHKGNAQSADRLYLFEIYGARIKVYALNEGYFIKELASESFIKDVYYVENMIFWSGEGRSGFQSWNLLSDRVAFWQTLPEKAQMLTLGPGKGEGQEIYLLGFGQNSLRLGNQGRVVLPEVVLEGSVREGSRERAVLKDFDLKEHILYEGAQPRLDFSLFLQKGERLKSVHAGGIKTSLRFLEMSPSLKGFLEGLDNFSWKNKEDRSSLEILFSLKPWQEQLGYNFVEYLFGAKELPKAVNVLEKLKPYVKNLRLWNEKYGILQHELNKNREAKGYLRKAGTARAFYYLGRIALLEGALRSALNFNLEAVKRDKTLYQAYNNLALVYQRQKNFSKAEEVLLEGIEAAPQAEDLYFNLGLLYQGLKKPVLAMALWEKVLRHNPGHLEAANQLYYVYLNLGEEDAALALVKQVLERYPADSISHYNIALLYQKRQEWARAVFHFQAFLSFSADGALKKQVEEEIRKLIAKLKRS